MNDELRICKNSIVYFFVKKRMCEKVVLNKKHYCNFSYNACKHLTENVAMRIFSNFPRRWGAHYLHKPTALRKRLALTRQIFIGKTMGYFHE